MVEMCTSSVQQKRLCLFTLCIILLVTAVMPARPHQRGALKASMMFTEDQMEMKNTISNNLETEESKANKDCSDDMDEEECLDRRTLVAHTDYIYTQHHKKP